MAALAHNVLKVVRKLSHVVGPSAQRCPPSPPPRAQSTLQPIRYWALPHHHGISSGQVGWPKTSGLLSVRPTAATATFSTAPTGEIHTQDHRLPGGGRKNTKRGAGDCGKSSQLRFLKPGSERDDGGGQGVPEDVPTRYLLGGGELLPLPGPDGLPVVLGAFAGLPAPPPLPPPDFPPPPPLPLSTGADTLNLVSSFRLICRKFSQIADVRATKRATSTALLAVVRSAIM